MKSNELRNIFINYFKKADHQVVSSSSLIPQDDPTLLFTNAGMVQFKEVFLGHKKQPYSRAVTIQRCIRAGGKHNDLDNVGYTARHHTFFEMMGNFSFGDYFKREAIEYAWNFLTQVLKLPPEKLWITVFKEDKEARDIWIDHIGVDPHRFSYCSEKDNFWSMGDTGPCGPCTEIFYDHGAAIPGGPPGTPEADGDRYIEIWNVVFMQYNRSTDGILSPLPNPSVDTGMGLERIAAVLQGVHDNYDIDIFKFLLKALSSIIGYADTQQSSMRVIVDHIRSASFLIADGIIPSNEGRGYVLRRIIRRALRHAHKLGQQDLFFYRLVEPLAEVMGEAYPILIEQQKMIEETLQQEEKQFALTLSKGIKLFKLSIENLKDSIIPGDIIFQLYDTYGFPADLTEDMARELKLVLDWTGFEKAMEERRAQSRQASHFGTVIEVTVPTLFKGYETLNASGKILALQGEEGKVDILKALAQGIIVLDQTSFYGESGGQVGDVGVLEGSQGCFRVFDTQKQGEVILHIGQMETGEFKQGETIKAMVDAKKRAETRRNHSATHLLHEALKQVLGRQVEQKGSLVEPTRLRFDFSYIKPLTDREINAVEELVNKTVKENRSVCVSEMTLEEAKKKGAIALFDKYSDQVRVVTLGDFSMELCGGTHVASLQEIGRFKIINQAAVAAGIRRIEALTGEAVIQWEEQQAEKEREKEQKIQFIKEEKEKLHEQQRSANSQLSSLLQSAKLVKGVSLITAQISAEVNVEILRNLSDQLKRHLPACVVVLSAIKNEKIQLVVAVSSSLLEQVKANELLNYVSHQVEGKGGGRPDFAQGGGVNIQALPAALASVSPWLEAKLAK